MKIIPSSSSWLSNLGAACNILYVYRAQGIRIAHVIGMIAFFLQTQFVTCTPTQNSYQNGIPAKEDTISNVDQNTNYERNEYSDQTFSEENSNNLDYFSLGDGYKIDYDNTCSSQA